MKKYRVDAKTDANQQEIVEKLRQIPGVTVETEKDDILVGYKGLTFWFEIKNPETVCNKKGEIYESSIKPSQKILRDTFTGHYRIFSSFEQIWNDIQTTIKKIK